MANSSRILQIHSLLSSVLQIPIAQLEFMTARVSSVAWPSVDNVVGDGVTFAQAVQKDAVVASSVRLANSVPSTDHLV